MRLFHALMALAARHARIVLVLGLVAGIALPGIALAMRPWIGPMVAGLLFLAALRVGPRQAVGALSDIGLSLKLAVLFQVAFPLAALALVSALGVAGTDFATFLVLMLAAAPITGSPHLTVMSGNDPAPALRQLVLGTAVLPLTVIPVFWLTPSFGDPMEVLFAAGGLMAVIGGATGLAFLVRSTVLRSPGPRGIQAVDGFSAVAMAVVVIGLMSAVGPALGDDPLGVAGLVAAVSALNFALQVAVALVVARLGWVDRAAAYGIGAGNRNIALFLSVLSAAVVDPILLLIGCFQIPMYLTPALLGRFYSRFSRPAEPAP